MSRITLPLDKVTDDALERIAAATQRDKVAVAAEALAIFAREEAEIVAAIEVGRADSAAGNTVSHREAMSRLRKSARPA